MIEPLLCVVRRIDKRRKKQDSNEDLTALSHRSLDVEADEGRGKDDEQTRCCMCVVLGFCGCLEVALALDSTPQ